MRQDESSGLLLRFARNRSGSVIALFAVFAVIAIALIGFVLDYGRAINAKAVLSQAADAAALAAAGKASQDFAANMSTQTAIDDAQAAAQQLFLADAGPLNALMTQPIAVNIQRAGQTISASVTYRASIQNLFGRLLTINSMNLVNTSTASLTLGQYLNFYLLLDVSSSMGIPSTNSEQTRLAAVNPDYLNLYPGGCTFACHFTAYSACTDRFGATTMCQGFNLTRPPLVNGVPQLCAAPGQSNCIQLRLDAVASAVQQLMTTATQTQRQTNIPNQFSVGLYPFVACMSPLQALTANLSAVSTAAQNLPDLIDNGYPATCNSNGFGQASAANGNGSYGLLGSGGTHFENALTAINATIVKIGDGSSTTSPKPFVFLVTDGAQDNQVQLGDGAWQGSNSATTLDPNYCAALKNRGVTVSVLYVPYVAIQNPTTFANSEDFYANANIPNIPPALQSCASPGFFFTASSPADINAAMQAMFKMAVSSLHLTH